MPLSAPCPARYLAVIAMLLLSASPLLAADSPKTQEDLERDKAIAEFTAKMKAANYPALFEKAAAEFEVPADILKGVAFTLTRWEHLTWPPGENFAPENGMPRPYGIMSLWSNDFFGMSLIEAARLIGKDPEDLKKDPLDNIRGGAALLKKLYGETNKPAGTADKDIESWRYAMAEYVGIPEPDLKHRFALEVYEHMNKGYHQYGIEWDGQPVNLGPMREDVKKLIAAEDKKREEKLRASGLMDGSIPGVSANQPTKTVAALSPTGQNGNPNPTTNASGQPAATATIFNVPITQVLWLLGTVALVMLAIGALVALSRRSTK